VGTSENLSICGSCKSKQRALVIKLGSRSKTGSSATAGGSEPILPVGSSYIRLIRRYRLTSGTTLPAMMAAPSPTATAASNRIFTCQVSPLVPITGTIDVHLSRNTVQSILNTVQLSRSTFKERSVDNRQRPAPNKRAPAAAFAQPLTDGGSPSLWFDPPTDDPDRRHQLTRERVVAEALAVIAHDGVQDLTMRRLAARLGVVPGALYHHVRNKERLHDLVLDNVLAEVDFNIDPSLGWTAQLKLLAHRLRTVLEDHPGVAGILKTRDPLGPHSLALAEAFLGPLQAAGFGDRQAGLAFFLLVDYTIGFAVGGTPDSVNEQRVRDPATRTQLHQFFRSLPPDRFPALVALGAHVWVDNRDQRFRIGLEVLVDGLEHARTSPSDQEGQP
jgi:AcrR family transcriptional regulator